jgi:uncharacterized protein YjdB
MREINCIKTGKWAFSPSAFACFVAIIVCGFVFMGCDDGNSNSNNQATDNTVPVIGVTLNQGDFGLNPDETKTLNCTVFPANASNKKVSWLSSLPRVASVKDGVVSARSEGTATITVITDDGRKSASCTVTVSRIVVSSVTLAPTTLPLKVGETGQLTPTVLPAEAPNKTVSWLSSNTNVASVSTNGTVTGVATGSATITAVTNNHLMASCAVTVSRVPVTGVALEPTLDMGLWVPKLLTPIFSPANATNKNVTWESSNTNVATVASNGAVTGVTEGSATITVTTEEGGFHADCVVTTKLAEIPMVWIKPGNFTMGSPDDEEGYWEVEGPQHEVTLTKGYYMGTYQISQGVYKGVMGYNPSYFNVEEGEELEQYAEYVDLWPVDSVTWYDAVEFCNKLSLMRGLTRAYTITGRTPATGYPITNATVTCNWNANGYRLPTDAEWEYACRADTTTPFNFWDKETNQWGSEYIRLDQANFDASEPYNGRNTSPNGQWSVMTVPGSYFSDYFDNEDYANEWGLYSMHGNLQEWCWDWLDYYDEYPAEDPKGPESRTLFDDGYYKVTRGGSWWDYAESVRSASRAGMEPGAVWYLAPPNSSGWEYYGFRIVCYGEPPIEPSPKAVGLSQSGTAKQKIRIVPQSLQKFDKAPPVKLQSLRKKAVFE